MKLTITQKQPTTQIHPFDIMRDGKAVGDLIPNIQFDGSIRWHACIRLPITADHSSLIQGHGNSHESAIADAIKRAFAFSDELRALTQAFAVDFGFKA